ncbi:BZ3500_MvSof-1268-A1-R1_Chr9g10306 [Microbotryum saponariae]|uniref:BZ3500_MvSof-1268-A1-R1_Chr9g10306 protein n=1 Tax=Microbotryum saponariae TaxID=289078 RepID=A0A2X0N3T7_9BASI|nr:BZ3501_MvSof-1269-A2-R1_Chr9g10056 [Microbotryum saponariae]SCZ99886.1 BZ3500_MvSof-1268-A1-R1_Chr9g10306 [Microbotryum saponariae]
MRLALAKDPIDETLPDALRCRPLLAGEGVVAKDESSVLDDESEVVDAERPAWYDMGAMGVIGVIGVSSPEAQSSFSAVRLVDAKGLFELEEVDDASLCALISAAVSVSVPETFGSGALCRGRSTTEGGADTVRSRSLSVDDELLRLCREGVRCARSISKVAVDAELVTVVAESASIRDEVEAFKVSEAKGEVDCSVAPNHALTEDRSDSSLCNDDEEEEEETFLGSGGTLDPWLLDP